MGETLGTDFQKMIEDAQKRQKEKDALAEEKARDWNSPVGERMLVNCWTCGSVYVFAVVRNFPRCPWCSELKHKHSSLWDVIT